MLKYSNIRKGGEKKKKKISRDRHASCAYFLYQFLIPIFFRKTEYKLYIWYICSWKFRWKRKDRKKKEYKNNSISWFVSYCLLPCTRFAHFAILLFTFPLLLFPPSPLSLFLLFCNIHKTHRLPICFSNNQSKRSDVTSLDSNAGKPDALKLSVLLTRASTIPSM